MKYFEEHQVGRLNSVGHLFPVSQGRRGIYRLGFSAGDFYVGQTVNIVGRVAEHRRRWPDLTTLQFMRVPSAGLDELEQAHIKANEAAGLKLRNLRHALGPADAACDLDWEVTRADQHSWLNDGRWLSDDDVTRVQDAEQRARGQANYEKLRQHPQFELVVGGLRRYVRECLPRPRATELTFWSLSAMPTNKNRSWTRLATLSVNSMETLMIGHPAKRPDEVQGFLNIGSRAMRMSLVRRRIFWARHRQAAPCSTSYEAAGSDVMGIDFNDVPTLDRLLSDPRSPVTAAARELNLRLMRKGPTMQYRWHCLALADHLVEDQAT